MNQIPNTEPTTAEQTIRFAEIKYPTFQPHWFMDALKEVYTLTDQFKAAQILEIPTMSDRIEAASGLIAQQLRIDDGYNYMALALVQSNLTAMTEPFQSRMDALKAEIITLLTDVAHFHDKVLHSPMKAQLAAVKQIASSLEADLPRFVEMVGVKRHCEQTDKKNCSNCKYRKHEWCVTNIATAKKASLAEFNPADLDADLKTNAFADLKRELPHIQFDAAFHIIGVTQTVVAADLEKIQSLLTPYVCEQLNRNGIPTRPADIDSLHLHDESAPKGS